MELGAVGRLCRVRLENPGIFLKFHFIFYFNVRICSRVACRKSCVQQEERLCRLTLWLWRWLFVHSLVLFYYSLCWQLGVTRRCSCCLWQKTNKQTCVWTDIFTALIKTCWLNSSAQPLIINYTGPLKGLPAGLYVFFQISVLFAHCSTSLLRIFRYITTYLVVLFALQMLGLVLKAQLLTKWFFFLPNTTDWRLVPHAELVSVSSGFSW